MANLHDIMAQDLATAVFDPTLPESPTDNVILIDHDGTEHTGIAALLTPVEVDSQDDGNGEVHVYTREATIMTTGAAGYASPEVDMFIIIDSVTWRIYGVGNINEITAELQLIRNAKISKHHENHIIRNR